MVNVSFARGFQTLVLALVTFCYGLTIAQAQPLTVTGFTKIVDGSTLVPNDPPYTFYDGDFIPTPGSAVQLKLSHDGVNTAFLGCSGTTACMTNHFGAYYGTGGAPTRLMDFASTGAAPLSVSLDGDEASFLECAVSFGCIFGVTGRNINSLINELIASGVGFGVVNDPFVGHNLAAVGEFVYDTDLDTSVTIADTTTSVPSESGLFTDFEAPDINTSNRLVFLGGNTSVQGLFTDEPGGTLRRIVSNNQFLPGSTTERWLGFSEYPAISGPDAIFAGEGSLGTLGIWRDTAGTLTQIIDYSAYGITNIDDHVDIANGTVAFETSGASETLYLWNDGDVTSVISAGDTLDGRTVATVVLRRGALADNSIAFAASFTNGTAGIFVAYFFLVPIAVDIDVDPWSPTNIIKPNSDLPIPVAVLGSSAFDVMQIDPATVKLGFATTYTPNPWFDDFDNDPSSITDAIFAFHTEETGIACNDTEVTLTGETLSGDLFEGTDTIDTTDCVAASCHP